MTGPIDDYLANVLAPRLANYGLSSDQVGLITTDVGARLASVVSRWNDPGFRCPLLETALEQAIFYKPYAPGDVRALVVVGVRNSRLEAIASTDEAARKYEFHGRLVPDADIPTITGEAIRHFARIDLPALARATNVPSTPEDHFDNLPRNYPVAWEALRRAASLRGREQRYEPGAPNPATLWLDLSSADALEVSPERDGSYGQTLSGMDPRITPMEQRLLRDIRERTLHALCLPSFKHLARNADKLLKILEFVLTCGSSVVTPNYLLSNGLVCKRKELLRPAHFNREVPAKFADRRGLAPEHAHLRDVLAAMQASL